MIIWPVPAPEMVGSAARQLARHCPNPSTLQPQPQPRRLSARCRRERRSPCPRTARQAGAPVKSGHLPSSYSRLLPAQEGAVSPGLPSCATASTPWGIPSGSLFVQARDNKLMENRPLPRERRTREQSFAWTSRPWFTISALVPSQGTLLVKQDPPLLDKQRSVTEPLWQQAQKTAWAVLGKRQGLTAAAIQGRWVMTWHDMTWHDMTWHDMTWHDMTWHGCIHSLPHQGPKLLWGLAESWLCCGDRLSQARHKFAMSLIREL